MHRESITMERALIQITREFSAPPEAVFDAWLDPDVIPRWLFAAPSHEIHHVASTPIVGGSFSILERAEHDKEIDHFGWYRTIERPSRLVFTLEVPAHFPGETYVTIEVAAQAAGSVMTFTQDGAPPEIEEDWRTMFDQLAKILAPAG
jgi:uncharacterized protein YndB with AHSA1/START domain